MILFILKMDEEKATEICSWKYPNPYDIHPVDLSKNKIHELLNGSYYAAMDESGDIVGFYCFGDSARVPLNKDFSIYSDTAAVDIGLALRPDLCGIGLDLEFLKKCTILGKNLYLNNNFRLTVASCNKPAIDIYKKFGFKEADSFEAIRENERIKFITMTCTID